MFHDDWRGGASGPDDGPHEPFWGVGAKEGLLYLASTFGFWAIMSYVRHGF